MAYLVTLLTFFVIANEPSEVVVGRQYFVSTINGPVEVRIVSGHENQFGKKKFDAEIIRSNLSSQKGRVLKGIESLSFMNVEAGTCYQGFCVGQTRTWVYDHNPKFTRQINILAIAGYSNTDCDFIGEGPGLFNDNRHITELICHKFEDFK